MKKEKCWIKNCSSKIFCKTRIGTVEIPLCKAHLLNHLRGVSVILGESDGKNQAGPGVSG